MGSVVPSIRPPGQDWVDLAGLVQRQIFPNELPLLLGAAGLELVARHGDFACNPMASWSLNQVCLARGPGLGTTPPWPGRPRPLTRSPQIEAGGQNNPTGSMFEAYAQTPNGSLAGSEPDTLAEAVQADPGVILDKVEAWCRAFSACCPASW